jgi:hypothetical protein
MASIALTIIGCIGYLDIGAIFMRAVFLFVVAIVKKGVLFHAKKGRRLIYLVLAFFTTPGQW